MSFMVHLNLPTLGGRVSESELSSPFRLRFPTPSLVSFNSNYCLLPSSVKLLAPALSRATPFVCRGEDGDSPSPTTKKGFGKPATEPKKWGASKGPERKGVLFRGKNAAPSRKESSSQFDKLVNIVDKKGPETGRSSINPSQAKLGKVDFVRVQSWGLEGEDSPKLEDLKVKSFSPAVTSSQRIIDGPFYEKLVNRLQLLESKGEITVTQVKPLPTFDRWVFGEERYLQFLIDQLLVFEALRDSIGAIRKERCRAVVDKLEEVVDLGGAACAIGSFDKELGLDRCQTAEDSMGLQLKEYDVPLQALSADITSIINLSVNRGKTSLASLTASTQAIGYAKYLRQLGNTTLVDGQKAKQMCLKLLAHLFSLYVSHLTTGMRIGAKAMDNIPALRQSKAISFYRDYPLQGKDPLKLFIESVNSAGSYITLDDDHEQVMQELVKAFQRTSLMLSVLAVEEQFLVA